MYQHILVPIDESELATETASKAIRLAAALGSRLTFFHALRDLAATGDGAFMQTVAPAEFAVEARGNARAVLARAEAEARAEGVVYESVARTSDWPHEAILQLAEERGCDLIFMASHGRKGIRNLFLGSQTQKVLSHTRIPVLVSSVEGNAKSPEMDRAIALIKAEHRSLAAVIHGFKSLVVSACDGGKLPDGVLLQRMVGYLRNFTEKLHHPKEDEYLFVRLKERTDEFRDVLDTLEAQHHDEHALIDAIEQAVQAFARQPVAERIAAMSIAMDAYAEHVWDHMSLEEKVILPACQKRLGTADWLEIHRVFESNGDPRFGADRQVGFEKLFARLMNSVS
jgi:nucleotide-binding universal stress UspA family protein/hemerythrin-like domain-containing protein